MDPIRLEAIKLAVSANNHTDLIDLAERIYVFITRPPSPPSAPLPDDV